jgi:tetratricopeptide (TPR) repeat protein
MSIPFRDSSGVTTMGILNPYRALFLFSIGIGLVPSPGFAQASGCSAFNGDWSWFTNATVTLKSDHTVFYNGAPAGKWECTDESRGTATIHWSTGPFVDSIAVSGDRISGTNQQNAQISATRKSASGGTTTANPAPRALPTSGSGYSVAGANAYVRAKDWNGLVGYARAWTRAQPNEPLAWYYLGNVYSPMALNQPQNSIQPYQHAEQLKSPWPEVWNDIGSAYYLNKQYKESADAFTKATEQNPKRIQYWNNLAAAQTEAGNFGLSQKTLDEGKKEAGDTATASDWFVLGNGYSQLKMFTAAVDAYQRCLKLDSRAGPAWTNLGAALEETGNVQGALNDYKQAAALGDPLGKENLTTLTEAIRKAEEQRQQQQVSCDAFCVAGKMHAGQMRDYFANHPGASISEANAHISP